MTVVTWRQAELGYALIGQPQGVDLTALGKQISSSQVAPLFSRDESRAANAALLASAKVPFNTRSVF
jgi:hypothetical protein